MTISAQGEMATAGENALIVARLPYLCVDVAEELYSAASVDDRIRQLFNEMPELLSAIWMASPSLHAAVKAWLDTGEFKNSRVRLKLFMYLIRMSTRPTPFGLFAGVGRVELGEDSSLRVSRRGFRTLSRPDMGWLYELLHNVECRQDIREKLPLYVNDLLLKKSDRIFVLNPRKLSGSSARTSDYARISLRETSGVRFILDRYSGRATHAAEIATSLATEFAVEYDRAIALVDRLVEAGLLLSGLLPSPIGNPFREATNRIEAVDAKLSNELKAICSKLQELDTIPVQERTDEQYITIGYSLQSLHPYEQVPIQIDLSQNFEGVLGRNIINDASILAQYALRCAQPKRVLSRYLDSFIEAYEGADRMVPLLELLDGDFGLGAAELDDVPAQSFIERDSVLLEIAQTALAQGQSEVELSDEACDQILMPLPDLKSLPPSFELGFSIDASDSTALSQGQYLLVPGSMIGSTAAGRTLGRFAHLLGERFTEDLVSASNGAQGDVLRCDLTYVPTDARAVNVAVRPRLLAHELQIGLETASSESHRISASDLLVGIRNQRFFLWSRSLNREVEVRECHALDTHAVAPALVRFLSVISGEGIVFPERFHWGAAQHAPFLPRIKRGRLVLSRARWVLDLRRLRQAADKRTFLRVFKEKYHVPDFVFAQDRDNAILIRFDHELAPDLLLSSQRDKAARFVSLVECLPRLGSRWLQSAFGAYRAEFVVSLYHNRLSEDASIQAPKPGLPTARIVSDADRIRLPSSEWTYVELYCGPNQTDTILAEVKDLVRSLRVADLLDLFFFVRYSHPRHQLRLRFRVSDPLKKQAQTEVILRFVDGVVGRRLAADYSIATYKREIERYGGVESMNHVEALFSLDTDLVLDTFSSTAYSREDDRMRAAIVSADYLITAFVSELKLGSWLSFTKPKSTKLGTIEWALVREMRDAITQQRKSAGPNPLAGVAEELSRRSSAGTLTVHLHDLLSSLLHMHYNRFGVVASEGRARLLQWSLYNGLSRQKLKDNVFIAKPGSL